MLSQRALFLRYQARTIANPLLLEISHAEGVYLYPTAGKPLIDLISGIAVSNLGHGHPAVKEAVCAQVAQHMHLMVYGEIIQTPQVKLAEALAATLPEALSMTYFVNSGSEAIEGALKLAKRYTGRSEIISCQNAYHGSTHGALSVGGDENFKRNYRPLLPDIRLIRFGVEDDLTYITEKTAALLLETVQGEAGVRAASPEYFGKLRKRCKQTNTLLILDEVQTGFGRTGKFWAFEHYGIAPDILTCAKAMGGGMPIGAFISSPKIMAVLQENPILGHITTFGGHPVCAAAALANLKVLRNTTLIAQVNQKAALFYRLLSDCRQIKKIRYKGLMMALELENAEMVRRVVEKAPENGLLIDWFLFCDTALRIAPPLIMTTAEIEEACKRLKKCLSVSHI